MEYRYGTIEPLDHVSAISDTIFGLQFLQEVIETEWNFSQTGHVGMSVVVRDSCQRLQHARDFFLRYFSQQTQRADSGALPETGQ